MLFCYLVPLLTLQKFFLIKNLLYEYIFTQPIVSSNRIHYALLLNIKSLRKKPTLHTTTEYCTVSHT